MSKSCTDAAHRLNTKRNTGKLGKSHPSWKLSADHHNEAACRHSYFFVHRICKNKICSLFLNMYFTSYLNMNFTHVWRSWINIAIRKAFWIQYNAVMEANQEKRRPWQRSAADKTDKTRPMAISSAFQNFITRRRVAATSSFQFSFVKTLKYRRQVWYSDWKCARHHGSLISRLLCICLQLCFQLELNIYRQHGKLPYGYLRR